MRKLFFSIAVLFSLTSAAQYTMEFLNRGLHAVPDGKGKVLISWRLFGTEDSTVNFNLYKSLKGNKSAAKYLITAGSSYLDQLDTTATCTYTVKAILNGKEEKEGTSIQLLPGLKNYLAIPLQTPAGYTANDASVGDMDGDGDYEIVIHMAGKGKDNSQGG